MLVLASPSSQLRADDGVIEINQVRAEAGGVTPGDTAGFPVLLTLPGSYRLTSNLDYRGSAEPHNRNGVEIRADGVVLDLNGFSIIGPTTCNGTPVTSCSQTGSGMGVEGSGQGIRSETVVKNGIVRGAGSAGVICDFGCVVENVHAIENGAGGVVVSNGPATVRNVTARRNGDVGIWNTGLVTGSVAHGNKGVGIFLNGGGTVSGNFATQNGGNGIRCNYGLVVDNAIHDNTGYGLELENACGYGRNVLSENDAGAITGAGIKVDVNVCAAGTVPLACP